MKYYIAIVAIYGKRTTEEQLQKDSTLAGISLYSMTQEIYPGKMTYNS